MICAISFVAVVRFTEPASVVLRVTWRVTILIFTFLVSWTLHALAYLHYAVGDGDRSRLLLYRPGQLMNSSHGIGRRLLIFCDVAVAAARCGVFLHVVFVVLVSGVVCLVFLALVFMELSVCGVFTVRVCSRCVRGWRGGSDSGFVSEVQLYHCRTHHTIRKRHYVFRKMHYVSQKATVEPLRATKATLRFPKATVESLRATESHCRATPSHSEPLTAQKSHKKPRRATPSYCKATASHFSTEKACHDPHLVIGRDLNSCV